MSMRLGACAITLAAVSAACTARSCSDQSIQPPREGIVFQSVSVPDGWSFGPLSTWAQIQMGGITKIPKEAFPASVATWPACSGTLIGDRVLLSAAHCFEGQLTATVEVAKQTSRADCETFFEKSPSGDVIKDLALCVLRSPIQGLVFERLADDNQTTNVGDNVLLTGNGNARRKFLTGETRVSRIDGNMVVTKDKAFTTLGDSGGAVYKMFGNRRVIAVNSQVLRPESFATLLSPLKQTIIDWQSRATLAINAPVLVCGIDQPARCRP